MFGLVHRPLSRGNLAETFSFGCVSVFTGPASRVSWLHRSLWLSQPVAEGTLDEGACSGSPNAPVTKVITPEHI